MSQLFEEMIVCFKINDLFYNIFLCQHDTSYHTVQLFSIALLHLVKIGASLLVVSVTWGPALFLRQSSASALDGGSHVTHLFLIYHDTFGHLG